MGWHFRSDGLGGAIGQGAEDLWSDVTGKKETQAAISAQERAAEQANDTQKYIYDQSREDLAPWRETGEVALGQLADPSFQENFSMGDFTKDPGYQFRKDEGLNALESSAAARGNLNSGRTLKDLVRYGQNFGSNENNNAYNRWNMDKDRNFNRLASLAGIGQTANQNTIQVGQNYGNNVANTHIGMGNAIASANIAQANRNSQLVSQMMGAGGATIGALYSRPSIPGKV